MLAPRSARPDSPRPTTGAVVVGCRDVRCAHGVVPAAVGGGGPAPRYGYECGAETSGALTAFFACDGFPVERIGDPD